MYKLACGYVMKGLACTGEKTEIRKQKKAVRSKRKMLREQESVKILGNEVGKTDRKRKLQQTANNGEWKLKREVTSKITNPEREIAKWERLDLWGEQSVHPEEKDNFCYNCL